MTAQQMIVDLERLALMLANTPPPSPGDRQPHEWAYSCGLAGAAIMQMRDRLIQNVAGNPPTV